MYKLFLIVLVIAAISSAGCARRERSAPLDEQPMYGGGVLSDVMTADSKRNDVLIRQMGSREAAVKKTLDEALATYQRGYFELAIHRYNQAWLLDPKNPEVFNGFALVLDAQGKEDEALAIYQKYLELNPRHAMTLCRLARQYQNKAIRQLVDPASGSDSEKEASRSLDEALKLYEKAAQEATLDVDLSFIYYQWAIALAVKKDTAGAWEKVRLSKKHGGQFIEPKFIETLSKDAPEPTEAAAQS